MSETKQTYTKRNEEYWSKGIMKEFNMLEVNNIYFEIFRGKKYPDWETDKKQKDSWLQYKSRVGNFLGQLDKDLGSLTVEDIETYIEEKTNARNHINGFILFHIKENTLGIREKIGKDILLHLLNV